MVHGIYIHEPLVSGMVQPLVVWEPAIIMIHRMPGSHPTWPTEDIATSQSCDNQLRPVAGTTGAFFKPGPVEFYCWPININTWWHMSIQFELVFMEEHVDYLLNCRLAASLCDHCCLVVAASIAASPVLLCAALW